MNSFSKKILKYIKNPLLIVSVVGRTGYLKMVSDELYLSLLYKASLGKSLDLTNPLSFNEKIQWLKLYDRKKEYTRMVDKYEAKEYVSDVIGVDYTVQTLGVWSKFDEIDFNELPERFVLKCTHDSGSALVVKNKESFDIEMARRKITKRMKRNFYYWGGEWPYKNVKPRIIAEEYLVDESGTELKDYKIFNFNGEPRLIQVDFNRFVNHKRNIYDTDWNYINMELQYQSDPTFMIPRPKSLQKMLGLARLLSKDIPFVRTDFYCVEDKVYFGEMTFYPEAGFGRFEPREWDYILGDWLRIDQLEKNVD